MGKKQQWIWGFFLGLALMLLGCGGEPDLCADVECGEGQFCEDGLCFGGGGESCEPECSSGEYCRSGRCVSESGGCDYHGQNCTERQFGSFLDDHLCMDWRMDGGFSAVCSQDCRYQACEGGEACFLVTVQGRSCGDDGDCLNGQFCYQGSCAFAACRPSECDLPGGADPTCGEEERCEAIGGSNLCVPVGSREIGDSCIDGRQAYEEQRIEEGCVGEAACLGGICRAYCQAGACPDADQECVSLPGSPGVEVCARSCSPGLGDCGEGETCVPAEGGGGVCQPGGTIPVFEACEVGGEGCEAGTICALEESGITLGRCLPVCDLGAATAGPDGVLDREGQAARDQTCPQYEPEAGIWTIWHLADAVGAFDLYVGDENESLAEISPLDLGLGEEDDFRRQEPGRIQWALREAGAAPTDLPAAEGEFLLGAGRKMILVVMAEAGRDRDILVRAVEIEGSGPHWVQGISDLEEVDIWIRDQEGNKELSAGAVKAGDVVSTSLMSGIYDVFMLPSGEEALEEAVLSFEEVEIEDGIGFLGFRGTLDPWDVHGVESPLSSTALLPELDSEGPLAFSCRPVNGGSVGACMQRCDGSGGIEFGRCDGESMGCGPRYDQARGRWTSVCQPIGSREEGEGCNPSAVNPCGEGLYCEAYGNTADHGHQGVCAPLCRTTEEGSCGAGMVCRGIAAGSGYPVGECRVGCFPDDGYEDPSCPSGLQACLPEATLIPTGDGINAGYDLREETPVCWASGNIGAGASCSPGNCIPGHECIFARSVQNDFISTLLSPYFGGGGQFPRCREICDPFTKTGSAHQCEEGETCLFNYPWNAGAGHCAEIVEERGIGEACEEPGMACGEDSICVLESGTPQCVRFCQFQGQAAGGYARSTCPSGFSCGPFVRDIGVCRASDG